MYCSKCGNEVDGAHTYCGKCGNRLTAQTDASKPSGRKESSTAAILSLLMPGLGQMYLGRMGRGIALLIVCTVLVSVGVLSVLSAESIHYSYYYGYHYSYSFARVLFGVALILIGVVVWIWNIFDANGSADRQ